jgi:hypothetical protein
VETALISSDLTCKLALSIRWFQLRTCAYFQPQCVRLFLLSGAGARRGRCGKRPDRRGSPRLASAHHLQSCGRLPRTADSDGASRGWRGLDPHGDCAGGRLAVYLHHCRHGQQDQDVYSHPRPAADAAAGAHAGSGTRGSGPGMKRWKGRARCVDTTLNLFSVNITPLNLSSSLLT